MRFRALFCASIGLAVLTAEEAKRTPSAPEPTKPAPASSTLRTELNLLGKTDTQSGESRRNENIQFNPIDNNALKELNVRMGATATIVQEFRSDRSWFSAEYGNRPAASLHLPAGRLQSVHGSLFASHNNSLLRARSFFQVGPVQPARENEYGFSLGSSLWRNASLSLDGSQQKIGGVVNGNVLIPKLDERTPLATDPAIRAIVERMLAAYPRVTPNRTDINERALNTNSRQAVNTDNASIRLDQNRGDRDRFTLRHLITAQKVDAFQFIDGQNPNTRMHSHVAQITWNRAWSAATTSDFSVGFDRLHSVLVAEPNAVGPNVTFGSALSELGPGSFIPIDRAVNRYRYAGGLRQSRGNHNWSTGFEFARRQTNGSEASSHRGVMHFRNDFGRDAITNFRLGIPSRYSVGVGDTHRGFRQWETQLYADDRWKAGNRLTLNYGVRYQPALGASEVNNLTLIPYRSDLNNFAPHFGFAVGLPDAWGTLRGAYGTHFGEVFPPTLQQLRWNPPGVTKFEILAPSLLAVFFGKVAVDPRSTIFVVPSDLRTPYSHQYNFSWEPTLARNIRLQFGYVGSRTPKLLMLWHNNRAVPVPGIPFTTQTVTARRPNPLHHEIRLATNSSTAYYDAARAAMVIQNWRGLSFEAAYWFSKSLDLGGSYTNTAAGDDARQGRSQFESPVSEDLKGRSTFDQPHSFLTRVSWNTPKRRLIGSWTVSAVVLAKSGTPFAVMTGSDGPGFGNVDGASGDRPNVVDPSVLGRTIGDPDTSTRLLPKSAFSFIRLGEMRGNLGMNTFRRGAIHNVNTGVSRSWNLGSEKSLTLRADAINLMNTPQFAEPTYELTSPSFGAITNTLNDGRAFQFLLRFRF